MSISSTPPNPTSASLQPWEQSAFPLLITGLPGVPGYNAFLYFRARYGEKVIGLFSPFNRPMTGPGALQSEHDRDSLERLFDRFEFQTVLDASGSCALKACELDPKMAWEVNHDIGIRLAQICAERKVSLIRLSTDLVFDGEPRLVNGEEQLGHYREGETPRPVTVYGKTMEACERAVGEVAPETLILRLPLLMGPSFNGHAGPIDWIEYRFRQGKPATLYFDEVRSNMHVQDLNRSIHELVTLRAKGLYHLGGPRALSLFQVAQTVNRVGGYPSALLRGCLRAAAGPIPPRAGCVTLNSDRVLDLLGKDFIRPWPVADKWVPQSPDWHESARHQSLSTERELYGYGLEDHPVDLRERWKGDSATG